MEIKTLDELLEAYARLIEYEDIPSYIMIPIKSTPSAQKNVYAEIVRKELEAKGWHLECREDGVYQIVGPDESN